MANKKASKKPLLNARVKKITSKLAEIQKIDDPRAVLKALDELQNIRPYKLYDTKSGAYLRGRYYRSLHRALNGALLCAKWLYVGAAIEVTDDITGLTHATYKRHVNYVSFNK